MKTVANDCVFQGKINRLFK